MAGGFDEILNDCTERLLQGESVEQCLTRYPGEAAELEPLLRIALAAGNASSAVEPRPEFKDRTRYEVQSHLRSKMRKAEPKGTPSLRWMPRWAVAVACLALVLVFAGMGTVAASSDSLPGDRLYAVKTAVEQIQLNLTFSDAAKARLQAKFADRRAREIARLAEKGRTARLAALSTRFKAHLTEIEQLAAQIEATDPDDSEHLTELKGILYGNMARDLALLDEAEAKAPWRSRSAVTVAKFRLTQEYEKAIVALDQLQNQQAQAGSSGGVEGDAQSGETGGGFDGGTGYGGSSGFGQQEQLANTGLRVQACYAGPR